MGPRSTTPPTPVLYDRLECPYVMPKPTPMISIVDDDLSVRRALRRLVLSAGYVVETFASAREFLAATPPARPACLVLDIYLDGMNGFELQEQLAADRITIPIIFMTAHGDENQVVKANGLGGAIIWTIGQGHLPNAPAGSQDPLLTAAYTAIVP